MTSKAKEIVEAKYSRLLCLLLCYVFVSTWRNWYSMASLKEMLLFRMSPTRHLLTVTSLSSTATNYNSIYIFFGHSSLLCWWPFSSSYVFFFGRTGWPSLDSQWVTLIEFFLHWNSSCMAAELIPALFDSYGLWLWSPGLWSSSSSSLWPAPASLLC